jgi:hypothetical protein
MTTETAETKPLLTPGTVVHALEAFNLHTSDTGFGGGAIVKRGDEIVCTDVILRLNTFLQHSGDEDYQIARFGKRLVGVGEWPDGKLTTRPGERDHELARDMARQAAWREPEGPQRAAALRAVEAKFGPGPSTSTQIAYYGGR